MNYEEYKWAVNKDKVAVCVLELKKEGIELTEENVKARYIKHLGLVREDEKAAKEENVERRAPKKPTSKKK